MKVTKREFTLAWVTLAAILIGVSYLLGEPMLKKWRENSAEKERYQVRIEKAERTLKQRNNWLSRFKHLKNDLPQHPTGKDVTSELLKTLERTAQENGLTLLRREPQKEKNVGDLYEVAINCTWEGELESLTRFLYAVQTKGAILDIHQLTVTPATRKQGRLKGNFTVDCAYSRTLTGTESLEVEVEPPASEDT